MKNRRIPLLNAGNGSGEHPTQALADWFAILKWKPELKKKQARKRDRIHLGILGTPGSMRAVKSFLQMSLLFSSHIRRISIVSELANPLGEELAGELDESGVDFHITNDINEVVSDLDVIYMNSIAFLGDSYRSLDSRFKLNQDSELKEDAVVLHPLARLDELDPNLDGTRSEEHTSELQSLMRISYAVFCLKKKNKTNHLQ